MRRRKWIFVVPAAILAIVLFTFVGGEVVRLLWNWLLPAIFGTRTITFWQALGMLALCRILFGGIGRHGFHRGHIGRRMAERWDRMTPEERERLRQRMRGRWGFGPPADETKAADSTL